MMSIQHLSSSDAAHLVGRVLQSNQAVPTPARTCRCCEVVDRQQSNPDAPDFVMLLRASSTERSPTWDGTRAPKTACDYFKPS